MKPKKWYIGAILLAAVVFAGALAGVAFAGSDQPQDTALDGICQSFVAKLAANLGIEQDKIIAALDATKKQMLEKRLSRANLPRSRLTKLPIAKVLGLACLAPLMKE